MTVEQRKLAAAIKTSVDALVFGFAQVEQQLFEESERKRAKYVQETALEHFLPLKWWRSFNTPVVRLPVWHKLKETIALQSLLASEVIDWSELAPLLNLYALNAAIEVTRLHHNGHPMEAVELAWLAESLRSQSELVRNQVTSPTSINSPKA
jgi:hypothetical protein